jgi:hypothetical protein
MAKQGHKKRHSRNRSFKSMQRGKNRTQSKRQSGGGAAEQMLATVGDGQTQFNNVMSNSQTSNVIQPIAHAAQTGGKRKSRASRAGRTRKGGYWGAVLEQAIVPLTLLGLQQKFAGRSRSNKSQRRH